MSKLKIDLLSDTHNKHGNFLLEGGDILIHSGDVSNKGTPEEIYAFMNWFADQDYIHLIMIPGNHDFSLENNFSYFKGVADNLGIHLLNDSGVTIKHEGSPNGELKIWGSPVQPWFHDWAFNRSRTLEGATIKHPWIKNHWDLIPNDTEILITHGPAMGILDEVVKANGDSYDVPQHVGCEELTHKIRLTPSIKLHVSGHIHEGRGNKKIDECTYVNASSLDRYYCAVGRKAVELEREISKDGKILYTVNMNENE